MMYEDAVVTPETVFGDGGAQDGGFMDERVGAGKQRIAGGSLSTTVSPHAGGSGGADRILAALTGLLSRGRGF